eukprot:3817383-Pyramimonas_sp.AAC.1
MQRELVLHLRSPHRRKLKAYDSSNRRPESSGHCAQAPSGATTVVGRVVAVTHLMPRRTHPGLRSSLCSSARLDP